MANVARRKSFASEASEGDGVAWCGHWQVRLLYEDVDTVDVG